MSRHVRPVKCFGGEMDGEIIKVDWFIGVGQNVKVRQPMKPLAYYDPNQPPLEETITTYNYILCVVHFSKDDKYYFLKPSGYTDKEALLYQFGK